MNKWMGVGRLAKDPELKYTSGDKPVAVCTFSVATNRDYKDKDGNYPADFHRCVAWGKTAEFVTEYLGKGRLVSIEAEVQNRSFEGEDGKMVYMTEMRVDKIKSLERPKEDTKAVDNPFEE